MNRRTSPQTGYQRGQGPPNQFAKGSQYSYNPGFPVRVQMQQPAAQHQLVANEPSEIKERPDSTEYARPIYIAAHGTMKNPELDEEFDIANLGIDLETTEPLLPYVYHVASDAPMALFGQYPAPDSYADAGEKTDAGERIKSFSDEALIFIFYVHARDRLQIKAAEELKKRRFVYDKDRKRWFKAQCAFDIESWSFVRLDKY